MKDCEKVASEIQGEEKSKDTVGDRGSEEIKRKWRKVKVWPW